MNKNMNKNKSFVKTIKITKLLEIKEAFMSNSNIDTSYYILMRDILEFFNLDRIFISMKTVFQEECVPIVEYIKGQNSKFFGEILDFEGVTKFCMFDMFSITPQEIDFINLCDENNYFIGDDLKKISKFLSHMGYVQSSIGKPSELIIFYMKTDDSFSIMFMERFENFSLYNPRYSGYRAKLSYTEILALNDLHNMLKSKLELSTIKERLHNEMYMKDLIIQNEKTPICMIEKTENRVIYYNENYEKYMPNVSLGACYDDLFNDEYYEILGDSQSIILQTNNMDLNKNTTNIKYWIKKIIPFTLADDTEVYMIYVKDAEDYITELKGIDLLTSSYSLCGFTERFNKLLSKNNKDNIINQNYVLCTLDIDKFKYINDSFSFEIGNKILKKITQVLNKFVNQQEIFCRMNEDKFAILLKANNNLNNNSGTIIQDVTKRIKELFNMLDNMRQEHFLDIKLTYICGVVSVNSNTELNILLDRANSARKTAKGSHKNAIAFFDEAAEEKAKKELLIESSVSKAVENNEFIPYLQPKFDLKTMQICGAEALVRWISPDGMIFPDTFIPLFEKNGFINTLDFIIYKKVMQHIRDCLDRNLPVYTISLNVSRNHIQNRNFVNEFMALINEYKIPIELIELEVTESVFVEDRELLKYFIDNIKRPKIKVSIDDFGTAYSSLQVLKDIDIDILKIDKGFLTNIDFSNKRQFSKDEVVLKNIINLAKDLNCKVICEGIETLEQINLLREIGCEYGQGYVFSKPIPIKDYEEKYLINK